MPTTSTSLEFGFYQEGSTWTNDVAIKNALLLFDGLAFLVPLDEQAMFYHGREWILGVLQERDLLHVLHPRIVVGDDTARRIQERILDELALATEAYPGGGDFSFSLNLDKLGVHHHPELVSWLLGEIAEARRVTLRVGQNSVVLPGQLGRCILHAVNAEISSAYSTANKVLCPLYESDFGTLHAFRRLSGSFDARLFCPILLDIGALKLDIGHVPVDEIAQFRKDNRLALETYKAHAAATAVSWAMLCESLSEDAFARAASARIAAMQSLASQIEAQADRRWRTAGRILLDAGGLAHKLVTGDYVGAGHDLLNLSGHDPQLQFPVSYLIQAKGTFTA